MASPSLDDDFVLILPQMRRAKGPMSADQRRLLVFQAIQGGVHGSRTGKGSGAPQVTLSEADAFLADHHRHEALVRPERREARALKNALRIFNRRDLSDKASDDDPEWNDTEEQLSWIDVKDLFR